jgi:Fe-Mn family superoxide dismutase
MFTVPDLPYAYDSLGENISASIMQLHHDKHHRTYVDKLNAALAAHPEISNMSIIELISHIDTLPEDIRGAVRNHGGGHYNHSLFWKVMAPDAGGQPDGQLYDAIVTKYGDFKSFVDEFTAKALGVFGSGWVWLQPDLSIVTSANQDNPLMQGQPEPLLGLDVWEHAYYLDYMNNRGDYIAAWWNVVNWPYVAERFLAPHQ